jgi:hypothetical protein
VRASFANNRFPFLRKASPAKPGVTARYYFSSKLRVCSCSAGAMEAIPESAGTILFVLVKKKQQLKSASYEIITERVDFVFDGVRVERHGITRR